MGSILRFPLYAKNLLYCTTPSFHNLDASLFLLELVILFLKEDDLSTTKETSVKYDRGDDSVEFKGKDGASSNLSKLRTMREEVAVRKNEIRDIEDVLPKVLKHIHAVCYMPTRCFSMPEYYQSICSRVQDNGLYLRIILGTVNLSLISKAAKYAYKNDYELFKLRVTSVGKIDTWKVTRPLNDHRYDTFCAGRSL